jgi:endonuclease IV
MSTEVEAQLSRRLPRSGARLPICLPPRLSISSLSNLPRHAQASHQLSPADNFSDLASDCAITTSIVESSDRITDMSSLRNTFDPDGPITAGQMEAIMARWKEILKKAMEEQTKAITAAIAVQTTSINEATAAIKDLWDRLHHRINKALTEEFALSKIT